VRRDIALLHSIAAQGSCSQIVDSEI
jgi:hypothetical protein